MITVGGLAANSQMQGLSSNDQSACDREYKGIGVMDISSITWGSVDNAQAPAYEVPGPVVDAIGGN
jgi:hypothetical protein